MKARRYRLFQPYELFSFMSYLSLCTMLLVQDTMLTIPILEEELMYSQRSFLLDNYCKLILF